MKKFALLLIALLFTANFTSTQACNVGYFDVILKSVVNDYNNCRSTWTYTVKNTGGKDLSHWVLPLCENHVVISSNYTYERKTNAQPDPTLGIAGIKWDIAVKSGETKTFTFVLDGIYTQTTIQAGIKAGNGGYYGPVSGPDCTSLCVSKPVRPVTLCVQPNGNGTYTAYFGYINENISAVTVPVGANNYFTPDPQNRNQTTVFNPGTVGSYPTAAFTVIFDGNPITWKVKGPDGVERSATASSAMEPCEDIPELGSLGDKVWYDTDKDGVQDNNESGVQGVIVKLYNCNHAELKTTTTDANGNYLFDELVEGDYYVSFGLLPGYMFTSADQGNDEFDSDANVTTGLTVCTTLAEGEDDLTWDAGIYIPETEKHSDLRLEKKVDNNIPKNGDEITFTIKITNDGPDKATNVQVTDLLEEGFDFVSSNGNYDNATGIWTVGELENGESKSLEIKVKIDVLEVHTTTFDLGLAKDFNLFVFESAVMPSSDTQGRLAVGGDASLSGYSVGDQLQGANGDVDVLIVGGHLQYTSGAVYGGNVVCGTSNLPINGVSISGGELKKGTPVNFDFAQAISYLTTLSQNLSGYTVNGNTVMEWGGLSLTGNDPLLNVFSVDGDDLSIANDFQITVPNGSVVLVNISGENVKWMGGLKVHGTDIRNVLYNFYQAEDLTISGIDVTGSILAPYAHVNFVSGVQNGQMICKSFSGQGQMNYVLFMGNIPEETTITNIAQVSALDQTDPDSTPNNGNPNEDDYSMVTVTINGTEEGEDGEGEDNGGTDESGNWEALGRSNLTDMIWSLLVNDGKLYAGTVGGKIFKSVDNGVNWERINSDMNVGWIWAMAIDNGKFYAATEQGIYGSSDGSTWSLIGLSGKDVRALKVTNGVIYAGTWGFGVFTSNDQGQTWNEMNNGLGFLAVHALVINSNNELFAGTFGGGVFKYSNGEWNKLDVGYDHVWALGITSTDKIYAGTYGGGVYYSDNNGASWSTINSGLPTQFIYAVTVDGSDNVYLNTWAGGIYGLYSQTNQWFATGMAGQGVTSIAASQNSSILYLGTKNGMVYKSVKALTEVDEQENVLPTEFALEQNYPNPFNPSTLIQFSIPTAGNYSIRVYNALGQMVETLADNNFEAGIHTIQFNAGTLSSGVYIYRLVGENVSISKKMILAK